MEQTPMNKPLMIDYYTDILCVWAWIAQRRNDELNRQLGSDVAWRYHYVDVSGDLEGKMQDLWKDRGMFEGFADHVHQSASAFEDAPINSRIWNEVRPATSANAHLVLKAVENTAGPEASVQLARSIRQAFFVDAQDVGALSVLFNVCQETGLDLVEIRASINDGSAIASLMSDYRRANSQQIKGSPSYVIDNGRQTLYGNVGYRVLHANIEEVLKQPKDCSELVLSLRAMRLGELLARALPQNSQADIFTAS
jgi:predicted DsbA family dithiol-disulfide isomerase